MNMENFFSGIKQNCVKEIYDVIKSSELECAFYRQKNDSGKCIGDVGILVSTPSHEINNYYSLFDKLNQIGTEVIGQENGFQDTDNQFIVEYKGVSFKIGNLRNGAPFGQNPTNRWKLDPRVVVDILQQQKLTPYMILFSGSIS